MLHFDGASVPARTPYFKASSLAITEIGLKPWNSQHKQDARAIGE